MEFQVKGGADFISVGYSNIGIYLKIKKPVSLIWFDCGGSAAQYLAMMPCSELTRQQVNQNITDSLYEDFTGRIDTLHQTLQPLFSLFEDGDYFLHYSNNRTIIPKNDPEQPDNLDNRGWYIIYPDIVDLKKINKLKLEYQIDRTRRGLQNFREDLVGFTSSWTYDSGEREMFIATRPSSEIDLDRVRYFEKQIESGERPFVILIGANYEPTYSHSGYFVLDGHHKLQAYSNLNIYPCCTYISRNFHNSIELKFDLETLSKQLYPWQIKHILDNWDDEDENVEETIINANASLQELYKNGLIEESHFNGKLKSRSFYINDKLDGKLSEWYDNGQVKQETFYHKGVRTGVYKEWYSSGRIKGTMEYNDSGQVDGKSIAYFENGEIRSEYLFENGQHADGYVFSKWPYTQTLQFEGWYENNILVRRKNHSEDSSIISEESYDQERKKWIRISLTNTLYTTKHNPLKVISEKNLNIVRERQYPYGEFSWKYVLLFLFIFSLLFRACSSL